MKSNYESKAWLIPIPLLGFFDSITFYISGTLNLQDNKLSFTADKGETIFSYPLSEIKVYLRNMTFWNQFCIKANGKSHYISFGRIGRGPSQEYVKGLAPWIKLLESAISK